MEITSAEVLRLPYRAGAAWAEREILAGRPVTRDHELTVPLEALPVKLRARAKAVASHAWTPTLDERTVFVHGTGIDDQVSVMPPSSADEEADISRLADPIHDDIGPCPEIAEPTEDAAAVVKAYEHWIEEFAKRAPSALSAWAHGWADEDERLREHVGVKPVAWTDTVPFRKRGNGVAEIVVNAQEDLNLFQQLRAAKIHHGQTRAEVDSDSWKAAKDVVGETVTFDPRVGDLGDLVAAHVAHLQRFDQLALAHNRARAGSKFDFDREAERWAALHGSERLKMGFEDGFRMISVYLEERLQKEMPGGYAHLAKDGEAALWQNRVAPTELALQLRRAIQAKLDEHAPPGQEPAKATIVWMKNIPDPMETEWDRDGNFIGRQDRGGAWQDFEAVLVPKWLDRYHLIGPVHSEEHQLSEMVNRWLDPHDYDLSGPRRGGMWAPAYGNVSVDTSDFLPAPVGGSSSTGDDDIPF